MGTMDVNAEINDIQRTKVYAVDFDGTLAITDFPTIIKANTHVMEKVKELKSKGNKIILWTCRCGEELEAAVNFCKDCGLEFDAVNENLEENIVHFGNDCRKVWADYYIDDKSVSLFDLVNNWM